jgi:hypothetical protein
MYKNQITTMENPVKIGFDLDLIAEVFNIERKNNCTDLQKWLSAHYELDADELKIFNRIASDMEEDGDYWNEEELKIQAVGFLFYIANIKVKGQIKVFYERAMAAVINGYQLAVISDCMVATPRSFSTPKNPYFFLQEFNKGKGEKKDPEAQMLSAMLIAQHLNNDSKPVYGGYLVGSAWRFTTLIENQYCVSRRFNADQRDDLLQIVFILRKLKELILGAG